MESHLYTEGIEFEVDNEYWLSQANVESWESVNGRVDRGKIGTQEVYRKEILKDKQKAVYSVALNFFEQFELEHAGIPDAKIEEEEGAEYLITEGINGDGGRLDREEAYGFASAMTLVGDVEWEAKCNFEIKEDPVLLDIEYIGQYPIHEAQAFREKVLKPWFERRDHRYDETEFNRWMKRQAQNLPEPEKVARTLTEEIETEDSKQEKFQRETIQDIEEAMEKARKGELTIDYISRELSDVNSTS